MNRREWYRCLSLGQWSILVALISFLMSVSAVAQVVAENEGPGTNLKIGERIPQLAGVDQFGRQQNFDSLKRSRGLVLLFFRSADW